LPATGDRAVASLDGAKSEIRNPKSEIRNPKSEVRNPKQISITNTKYESRRHVRRSPALGFRHFEFLASDLFRISCFGFRVCYENMPPAFQLILLPGLGSDYRLLEPQREEFSQLVVPPWIPPLRGESLPHYAARMAETVRPGDCPDFRGRTPQEWDCPPVAPGSPLVLGGVSFGGMLALEMARHLKPDAVVLIASCRSPRGLRPIYRAGRRLLPLVPVQAWGVAKLLSGPVVRLRIHVPPARRKLAVAMFKQSDSRFMHWTLHAILNWQPTPLTGIPVFHIHGGRDPLIPARRVTADEIIPDGGHLINVTHGDEVNRFIRSAAERG
jgi:pimeloyl-ACP methyl ester carboxylesterase